MEHFSHTPVYKVESRKGSLSTIGLGTNFITMIELPMQERFWKQSALNNVLEETFLI